MEPGCAMSDVIIHRRDPSAFIVFPSKCIALVLFMQLLATCDKRNASSKDTQCRRFLFCVDHLSRRCCCHACKYHYSSCHMHLIPNDIHSAPFLTSIKTSLVVCEGGVTVYAHLRIEGVHSTWRYNLGRQVRGWVGRCL